MGYYLELDTFLVGATGDVFIRGYGGDVLKFSGDAVTILWKVEAAGGRMALGTIGMMLGAVYIYT